MHRVSELPPFDRPREKLHEKGAHSLSDAELVAVILGSGNKDNDVRTLSLKVAQVLKQNLGIITLENLTGIDGIGPAKAAQIMAGFELARRYLMEGEKVKITCARDIVPLLKDISERKQEHFVCMSLNGANEVIESRVITVGLLDRTQIHPREVFADALMDRAASVIFAHNHPSGDLTPSEADLRVQRQLTEAAGILGLRVLDHVIISRKGFYSFQENGLI
ncbi:MAG: DNA repair protein RadC [Verrucomicrobiota bacterium]|nr:DNA repair protein RadC [Verrucomicrobiota bacterium]